MADNRQTRATLRDFLSSRGLSADSITLTPDLTTSPPSETANEGDDLGIDPNTGLPVLGLNGLTSAYVAFLTQQSDNFYNLSPQGEEAAPSTRGSPLAPPDHQGAQRIFARPGTTLGQAMQLSNSGRQDETDYPVSSYLDKTGGDDSKSGNSLLSSVQGRPNNTTGNPEIDTYVNLETQSGKMQAGVVESIANANRFNSQAGGVAVPNQLDSVDSQKLQSVQRSFSVYHKDDTATSSAYDYERLKDVGNWLLASAAGYIIPGNENERQTVDQYFTPVKRSNLTLESAAAQLNTRIGADNALTFDDVQASNARGFPKQPDGSSMRSDRGSATQPDISEAKYTRPSPVSYTSATPFDDSSNIGSSKLVQARALIAVNRLASLYNRNAVTPPSDTADTLKSLGPYYMGGSVYSRVNALNRMIMNVAYVPTRNPYPAAVEAGIGVMLGKEQIASPTQISGYFGMLPISPGFWEAVATSAVDIITKQSNLGQTLRDEGGSSKYYLDLSRSKAVQVMNVFATIGDIVLQVTGKEFNNDTFKQDIAAAVGIEQVDNLSVTAGTRIMKSREGSGRSPLALSWRGNSVPGLMLLSDNVIQASLEAGNLINGENPARGMLASSLIEKTYADPTMRGSKARIPGDIVKIIEDKLDAEYVPFYFHDLRTNEIIAFHAFLDSLQDSFSAQYASFKSYGRSDAAKMYTSTSRSVSLSFTVAATSRDDFDEMWYKLNRLIACVYPKYTEGTLVQNSDITFEQPFSQVIGATPLMRLRVGDVVKSNYSRFNLSRFFGIGNDDVDVKKYSSKTGADNASNLVGKIAKGATATANFFAGASNSIPSWWQKGAFYSIFGSPIKSIASINKLDNTQGKAILSSPIASSFVSNFLVNGFVNPIGYSLMTSWTQNPDNPLLTNLESFGGISDFNDTQNNGSFGFSFLKPRERPYDVVDGEGNKIGKATVRRALKVFVTSRKKVDRYNSPEGVLNPIKDADVPSNETRFYATVVDPSQFVPIFNDDRTSTETVGGDTLLVTHDDLQPDLGMIFAPAALIISPAEAGVDILTGLVNSAASALNLNASSVLDNVTTEGLAGFMSPNNNAIVRAFEHNRGRGLPGVITQLSFNWLDFNWETDWGARAPMGTKVTITFECMHDLPPGLDSGGYMRAPTHNVGSVMNTVAGDPYDDKGAISRTNFARDGASTIIKRG